MRRNHENPGIRCPQGSRALSALLSLSFAVTLGVGCSGEGTAESNDTTEGAPSNNAAEEAQSNDAAEDALIQSHLEGRGYDTRTLQFRGDKVIVEDDMVMSRAVLLDEAEAEATGVVEKGYFRSTTLFGGKRIQVSFASDVSDTWRAAFNAGRNEWNNKTPMFSRDPGGTATISVVIGSMASNVFAEGSFPPDRTITLNSNFSSTDAACGDTLENVPPDVKVYNALHEIGHVLGFEHPPPNPGTSGRLHIAGTEASNGFIEPTYATVMAQGCGTRTALTADDVLSAQKKYPSCIATCENNCTFNVDPAQIGLCQSACPAQCGG
jgi:hypothetical protein